MDLTGYYGLQLGSSIIRLTMELMVNNGYVNGIMVRLMVNDFIHGVDD